MSSRPSLREPASYVARGDWKSGRVDGPRLVLYAQAFAVAVEAAVGERSLRDVARQADISHTTLLAVLHGQRWPDMVTIAKLEEAFARDLWPGALVRRTSG
jgi:transcriptional regulator with XRE-family HTH domain